VADVVRPRATAKGVRLVVEAPADLVVRSDRIKVRRVLENLADNAVKFTHQGEVRLSAEASRAGLSLHVTDSGVGIAAEDQPRVFEDFVQVHNAERDSRKGFGLGLAIARRLAHQLGGHLSLESAPGRGSRFTLHLPAASLRYETAPDGKEPHARPVAVALPAASPRG
jgi:signal transduction histidine kinase